MTERDDSETETGRKAARIADLLCAALLLLLGAAALIFRIHWIRSKGYPIDYDSFYYLEEFRSYAASGHGYYHTDFQVYFDSISVLAKLLKLAPVQTFNFSVVSSLFLFAAGLLLVVNAPRRRWIAAGLALVALQSEPLFYLFYGYLKQAMGTALVVFGYGLLRSFQGRVRNYFLALPALVLVWGAFMHSFSFCTAALLVALWMVDSGIVRKCAPFIWASLAIAALMVLLRFSDQIGIESRLPWDWERSLGWLSRLELFQYRMYAMIAVGLAGAAAVRGKGSRTLIGLLVVWLLLNVPIWREGGVTNRWLISGVPIFFIMLAVFLRASGEDFVFPKRASLAAAAVLIFAALLPRLSTASPRPVGPAHPPASLEGCAEELKAWIPPDALVIAPHGVQFRVHYFLLRRSEKVSVAGARTFPSAEMSGRGRPRSQEIFEIRRRSHSDADCVAAEPGKEIPPGTPCVQLDGNWIVKSRAG